MGRASVQLQQQDVPVRTKLQETEETELFDENQEEQESLDERRRTPTKIDRDFDGSPCLNCSKTNSPSCCRIEYEKEEKICCVKTENSTTTTTTTTTTEEEENEEIQIEMKPPKTMTIKVPTQEEQQQQEQELITTTTSRIKSKEAKQREVENDDHPSDWFKTAVFYEVFVRSFCDSDGDGIGDLKGLTSKLEYLSWLGIDAIWLLPITQSPLRDHGYDVSDGMEIQSDYGTLADFDELVYKAHRSGIRIVVELIPNHTSDSHPWFQASRDPTHPLHEQFKDWYLWSETDKALSGTRIIFIDSEKSNWTWDDKRKAYYFHRFFSHQPDLNFDNPQVQQAVFEIVDFWASHGVDGIRVDAAPFLFKREGTTSEGLPETHEYFQRLRKFIDERSLKAIDNMNEESQQQQQQQQQQKQQQSSQFKIKRRKKIMLLCEANQWPRESAAFFGTSTKEEFSMAFNFPLMPRIFMSIAKEDSKPIEWALSETPLISDNETTTTTAAATTTTTTASNNDRQRPQHPIQWGTFLRNHDELTLEMVTDEEREFMWGKYAPDPKMRLNLGIRRRLAPLLSNDGNLIRMAHSILLSVCGSPFLYYGDEIGMGDNVNLSDRSGVRTPMQWSSSANDNAGFSPKTPIKANLFLPLIDSGEYSFKNPPPPPQQQQQQQHPQQQHPQYHHNSNKPQIESTSTSTSNSMIDVSFHTTTSLSLSSSSLSSSSSSSSFPSSFGGGINVNSEKKDPQSLLNWVRGALYIRSKHSKAFGFGSMKVISSPTSNGGGFGNNETMVSNKSSGNTIIPSNSLVFFRGFGNTNTTFESKTTTTEAAAATTTDEAIIAVHNLSSQNSNTIQLSIKNVLLPLLISELNQQNQHQGSEEEAERISKTKIEIEELFSSNSSTSNQRSHNNHFMIKNPTKTNGVLKVKLPVHGFAWISIKLLH